MSPAIHLIARNVPVYGPSDGRCLPCSGVSGSAVGLSPCSSCSHYKMFSQTEIVSLKCASRNTSSICNAGSGSYRRNSDFSKQNKHGFSRSRNRQNGERDDSDNFEESELFSSKNGSLPFGSGSLNFQATATPGPREMEIVELFRKVQAKLRERPVIKDEKKMEDLQGQSKQSETVDSLLKLLRKHSVQQGKRGSGSGSSRDFFFNQPEQNGTFSAEKIRMFLDSNNRVKHESEGSDVPSVSRPVSNFRRRSPVPPSKYQPIHSDEDTVNSVSHTSVDGKRKETSPEPEPKHEPKVKFKVEHEPKTKPEPIFYDGAVFEEMSDDETSETDKGDVDEAEEQNWIENRDLSGMKLPELRALAKSRGMKGFSKLKKRELMELLTGGSI